MQRYKLAQSIDVWHWIDGNSKHIWSPANHSTASVNLTHWSRSMCGRKGEKADGTALVRDKLWMMNSRAEGAIYVEAFSYRSLCRHMSETADQSLHVGGIWCSNSKPDLWLICLGWWWEVCAVWFFCFFLLSLVIRYVTFISHNDKICFSITLALFSIIGVWHMAAAM